MGVIAKANVHHNSIKTSDLTDWIGLLKVKKNNFKYQRRKNLFIEAILNEAICQAQTELRHKQQERKLRWQHLRSSLCIDSCDNSQINLDSKDYEELNNSLDQFMLELKSINVTIQR